MRPFRATSLVVGCSAVLQLSAATAQEYPVKPVRWIVAQTAGTPQDAIVRVVAPQLSKVLGQPVIVENRPGAGNVIGFEYVAKQMPADGYTVVSALVADLALLPLNFKDLRFDPLKDLPPVVTYVQGRALLGSTAKAPWKTFKEMIAFAKQNPNKFNYGAPNAFVRFSVAAILQHSGVEMSYIPYNAAGPYSQGLLSGDIHLGLVNSSNSIVGENFRVLAVTGESRTERFPETPTFAELGLPSIGGASYSLNVRAGTPQPIIEKLYASVARAVQQPELKAQYAKLNQEIILLSPDVAAKQLADQARIFSDIAKKIGFQPQ